MANRSVFNSIRVLLGQLPIGTGCERLRSNSTTFVIGYSFGEHEGEFVHEKLHFQPHRMQF